MIVDAMTKDIQLEPGESLPARLQGRYVPIPGKPGFFQLFYLPCGFQCMSATVKPCGKKYVGRYCALKSMFIAPSDCQGCKERDHPSARQGLILVTGS